MGLLPDTGNTGNVTHMPWCMSGALISGFLWSRWRGKHTRPSRRMRNPQFYVSGKRPIEYTQKELKFSLTALYLYLSYRVNIMTADNLFYQSHSQNRDCWQTTITYTSNFITPHDLTTQGFKEPIGMAFNSYAERHRNGNIVISTQNFSVSTGKSPMTKLIFNPWFQRGWMGPPLLSD